MNKSNKNINNNIYKINKIMKIQKINIFSNTENLKYLINLNLSMSNMKIQKIDKSKISSKIKIKS